MPSYEVVFLLKKMAKPETATVLKRAAQQIMKNNGILFRIEGLGTRSLPYRMRAHGARHTEGSYFLMQFDGSSAMLPIIQDEFQRDVDIIRDGIVRIKPEATYDCTIEEDYKPPAYRKDVQAMIEEGRKRERIFNMNTGLSYNPWKR